MSNGEVCADCKKPVGLGRPYAMDGKVTLCFSCYGRRINPPEPEIMANPAPKPKRERKPRAPRVCSVCGQRVTADVPHVKQGKVTTCLACFVASVVAAKPKGRKAK